MYARLMLAIFQAMAPRLKSSSCCRQTLTALGPSFIKAGQVLASRPDIVRADYMEELCTLQDDVPSFADDTVSIPTAGHSFSET